jgi:hypothetical protein
LEKKLFHTFLNNYTSLTQEEAQLLISLEKEFPYSQVIHSLAARAAQDHHLPEREEQLHMGAIYTTDRAVFKEIMTAAPLERKSVVFETSLPETQEVSIQINEIREVSREVISTISSTVEVTAQESMPSGKYSTSSSDESFYNEILHDLERLKELKNEFEETARQFENGTLSAPEDSEISPKKKSKPVDATDELLTEIKSSKKKIKPEGPKQKEQIEIIEQFIKTQPTIKGKVATDEKALPKDDLAEKSLIYNENIISETLVQILIKQGKKEKAVEVLKKLIWKFPQKKAYFAAQIEDLKK